MPPVLANLFARERRRIRRLLRWQGIARLLVLLAVAFWVGLLIDWSLEPSPNLRLALLVATGVAAFVWLVRTTLEPLLRPLPDRQLAVLIEAREPALGDSLITAVEVAQHGRAGMAKAKQPPPHPELAAATTQRAIDIVNRRDTPWLTDSLPTRRWMALALAGVASIAALGYLASETMATYARRLALSPDPWPRVVHLSIDDFIQDDAGVWRKTIARGDSLSLAVRADLSNNHQAPAEVRLDYTDSEGIRTRSGFARLGQPTTGDNPHQLFTHTIEEVRSDLRMRIRGGDARLSPVMVTVASRPVVIGAELTIFPPNYLEQPKRTVSAAAAGSLPEGSRFELRVATSKPVQQVEVHWTGDNPPPAPRISLEPGQREFLISTVPLKTDRRLEIQLQDTDGIASAQPYPILLAIEPDRPPRVRIELVGIASAVTPDAQIEMNLILEDDHALGSAKVDLQIDKQPAEGLVFDQIDRQAKLSLNDSIDLLTRRFPQGKDAGRLQPGQQLTLTAAASDLYDLDDSQRETTSGQIQLEVVTPDQLLARLEELEINLRRTFEQTVDEMSRARRRLIQLSSPPKTEPVSTDASKTTGAENKSTEESSTGETSAELADTNESTNDTAQRRRLRRAQLGDQLAKIAQETLSAAEAFAGIHEQLVHNRIDNTDLIGRIDQGIARPLKKLGEKGLPPLSEQVAAGDWQEANAQSALVAGEMERILQQMQSLETYNEVLAILRQVIDDQQRVQQATEQTRREQLRRLLVE